jgi:hypothetical protein
MNIPKPSISRHTVAHGCIAILEWMEKLLVRVISGFNGLKKRIIVTILDMTSTDLSTILIVR